MSGRLVVTSGRGNPHGWRGTVTRDSKRTPAPGIGRCDGGESAFSGEMAASRASLMRLEDEWNALVLRSH